MQTTNWRTLGRYWLCLHVCAAFMISLLINPPSSDFVTAFWNPTVWLGLLPLTGAAAWLLHHLHAPLKRFFDDPLTVQVCGTVSWSYFAWNSWEGAARRNDPVYKTAASILLLFAILMALCTATAAVSRLRSAMSLPRGKE